MTGRPTSDDAARALQSLIAAAFPNGGIDGTSPTPVYDNSTGTVESPQAGLLRFINTIPQHSTNPTISLATPVIDPTLIADVYHNNYTDFDNGMDSLHPPRASTSTSIYTPIATRSGRMAQRSNSTERAKDREAVMFNDYFDFPSSDEEDDLDFHPRSDDPEPDFDFNWGEPLPEGSFLVEEDNEYDTFGAPSVDEDDEEEEEGDEDEEEDEEGVDDLEAEATALGTAQYRLNSIAQVAYTPDIPIASTSTQILSPPKSKPKPRKGKASALQHNAVIDDISTSPTASMTDSATTSRKRAHSSSEPSSIIVDTAIAKKPKPPKKPALPKKPTKAALAKIARAEAAQLKLDEELEGGGSPATKRVKFTAEETAERRKERNRARMEEKRAETAAEKEWSMERIEVLEYENEKLKERLAASERRVAAHEKAQLSTIMNGGAAQKKGKGKAKATMADGLSEIHATMSAMAPEQLLAFSEMLQQAVRSQSL
jgi:hypothetical protein